MASWILPTLKAVLPHVGTIISAAQPMFSKTRGAPSDPEIQQQIAELQEVAGRNDAHIRELAAQLQSTVAALEQAAAQAEAQTRRMERLCWTALATAGAALVLAIVAMLPG